MYQYYEEGQLVRGLWAQRLLWLIGGTTALFPSSDFVVVDASSPLSSEDYEGECLDGSYCTWAYGSCVTPSHEQATSNPMIHERIHLMERLSEFLLQWNINNQCCSFTQAVSQLTRALSTSEKMEELKELWGKNNVLLDAWLKDLQKVRSSLNGKWIECVSCFFG